MVDKPFYLDFSDFNRGFEKIVEDEWPEHAQMGLFQAGALLIRDAITEEPTAPKKTGHLRRSQLIKPIEQKGLFIGIEVGFNVPYAGKLHEAPNGTNWTEPGSGPKFIETKMAKNKEKYYAHVAAFIKTQGKAIT